ncbi:UNKNOWN [Stylonychia lemnae]|uniref:Uncharacterized protein n=1 Tax=Stylonychia lemnae TaxID=5949 RepID=A0A078B5X2_STYLE|nr:UNKNOWN [Stylonychia lemnae]|eukprot:CDW88883.1 UNKNOWN [Stylonychia lemnae]
MIISQQFTLEGQKRNLSSQQQIYYRYKIQTPLNETSEPFKFYESDQVIVIEATDRKYIKFNYLYSIFQLNDFQYRTFFYILILSECHNVDIIQQSPINEEFLYQFNLTERITYQFDEFLAQKSFCQPYLYYELERHQPPASLLQFDNLTRTFDIYTDLNEKNIYNFTLWIGILDSPLNISVKFAVIVQHSCSIEPTEKFSVLDYYYKIRSNNTVPEVFERYDYPQGWPDICPKFQYKLADSYNSYQAVSTYFFLTMSSVNCSENMLLATTLGNLEYYLYEPQIKYYFPAFIQTSPECGIVKYYMYQDNPWKSAYTIGIWLDIRVGESISTNIRMETRNLEDANYSQRTQNLILEGINTFGQANQTRFTYTIIYRCAYLNVQPVNPQIRLTYALNKQDVSFYLSSIFKLNDTILQNCQPIIVEVIGYYDKDNNELSQSIFSLILQTVPMLLQNISQHYLKLAFKLIHQKHKKINSKFKNGCLLQVNVNFQTTKYGWKIKNFQ